MKIENISLDRCRTFMVCGIIKLYGSSDAVNHERCDADRYYRIAVGYQFWAANGSLPLDLRSYESDGRNYCRSRQS